MKKKNSVIKTGIHTTAFISALIWQPLFNIITGIFLTIAMMMVHNSAKAAGYHLILNGKSFHKEQPKKKPFNERNWGLGIQYDYALYKKNWQPYLTASGFRDSFNKNSFYAGGGMLRRFSLANIHQELHASAGFVAFVMVRKDYRNRHPFLGALPAFTLGTDKVAINLSYVPKVRPKLISLWFIQLKISL